MSMLGISMEKWIILMIVIFLCCLGRKFTGPDEQNIQTIMGVIEAESTLRHWGFTRDAEIHPVYNFLTANINLLQRTRGQRADRSCTITSLSCFLLVFKAYHHLQRYFIRRVWARDRTHSSLEYSRCVNYYFEPYPADFGRIRKAGLSEGETPSFEDIVHSFWRYTL